VHYTHNNGNCFSSFYIENQRLISPMSLTTTKRAHHVLTGAVISQPVLIRLISIDTVNKSATESEADRVE